MLEGIHVFNTITDKNKKVEHQEGVVEKIMKLHV